MGEVDRGADQTRCSCIVFWLQIRLSANSWRPYTWSMSTATSIDTDAVAERLCSAPWGDLLSACGFRFWEDEALGHVVEVVLILDREEWDDITIAACETARRVTDEALSELPFFGLPVCRTRTEHRAFEERERGIWIPVELKGAC